MRVLPRPHVMVFAWFVVWWFFSGQVAYPDLVRGIWLKTKPHDIYCA